MANILTTQPDYFYFGKFPGRGDFVKSASGGSIIAVFDQWISQAIEMMAPDPRWKLAYDEASAINFVFVGTRNKMVVAGTLKPSQDFGQRRFPFTLASRFEIDEPLDFAADSPMLLDRFWRETSRSVHAICTSSSDEEFITNVSGPVIGLDMDTERLAASFEEFLLRYNVESFEQALATAGHSCSLRQSVLALGMLLQPIVTHGASNLQKGLVFPLPADPQLASVFAAFWLNLAVGFLRRHDFELGVFMTQQHGRPILMTGFVGASAKALVSMVSPDTVADYQVHIASAEWIEEYVEDDAGLRKLSNYMKHPQLSLSQVFDTYNEVFLGL